MESNIVRFRSNHEGVFIQITEEEHQRVIDNVDKFKSLSGVDQEEFLIKLDNKDLSDIVSELISQRIYALMV